MNPQTKINITSLLRDNGFKVTPQRLAICDVLVNTCDHPSAEMIYERLRYNYPTMSLATVYKTIGILKELSLIQVLNIGEDSLRCDADTSIHLHVRCAHCSKVEDVHGIESEKFIEEVIAHSNYKLCGQQFYFFGICPECQKRDL